MSLLFFLDDSAVYDFLMKPAPALKPEQQQKHEEARDTSNFLQITVNEEEQNSEGSNYYKNFRKSARSSRRGSFRQGSHKGSNESRPDSATSRRQR